MESAQSIVGKVVHLLGEEYQRLSGVGSHVADLRDDLETMNALLRQQSEAEAEDGAVDDFVRVWMKQLQELAYDSEDCIDMYRLRIKSRANDGVRAWLRRLVGTLSPRHRLAGEILALRARATAISERHARYGVNRDALRCPPSLLPVPVATAPAMNADRHRFVGIEDQANALAERLKKPLGGETGTGEPKAVFFVVGFGGLGKTTLAMEVCRIVEEDFPFQAMVAVSQAFEPTRDLEPLLKCVLLQVLKGRRDDNENQQGGLDGDIDGLDVNQLATKLEQGLTGKRYLIVIDDVWTERAWEAIQCRLPENKCGSRVLVTTRMENVAKAFSLPSGEYIHHMEPLSQEDSRKLFLSTAFGSTDAKCPHGDHENSMDIILRKCAGMPLAIISIASVLAGYASLESIDKWERISRSIGSQMKMHPTLEGMSRILTLSYNNLPHELKFCMMYLSIFPEDYAIRKDRLLHRWMAEGFIPKKRGLTMLEVAESYFNELMSRNMIFSVQGQEWSRFDYDGKKQHCRLHDMLLEVVVSKSLECNFVSLLGGQYKGMSYDRIRRLSIHEHEGRGGKEEMNIDLQQHVRSLSMFQLQGNKLLLDQLGNFTLLRVLDLEGCQGIENKHVRYACHLYLLRFLSFKDTHITEVPRQISNLEHLQTLDLRGTFLTRKGLPATVTELEKLECLNTGKSWRLPEGLSSMKALCVLVFTILDNVKVAGELGELEKLQELGIEVSTAEMLPDDAGGKEAFIQKVADSLSKIYSLRSLHITHDTNEHNCLYRLQDSPRLLRHLHVRGRIGGHDQLPAWIRSLIYLVEIVLEDVRDLRDDEPFGTLCELPSLQSLKMEKRCYSGEELVARSCHNFPALVNLVVEFWGKPHALRFEAGSMSKLEKLTFHFFTNKTVDDVTITGIEHLTTKLTEVQLAAFGSGNNIEAFERTVEECKAESAKRAAVGSSQFQVIAKNFCACEPYD